MMMKAMSPRTTLVITLSAMALTLTTGCHKKPSALPPPDAMASSSLPAPTANITADPLSIDLGQSVVLNWRTNNATSVSIDGLGQMPVNGTQTVSPASSTNFHLVAKGDGGTTEANVRVTVRVPVVPTTPTTDTGAASNDLTTEAQFRAAVSDVFFDYDSYDISGEGQNAIAQAARYLIAHPNVKILIGGYCDERGSAEYNITLGENRANAARTALINSGVAPTRLRTVSFGKERQFCNDETESCYAQNRRAQFSLDR